MKTKIIVIKQKIAKTKPIFKVLFALGIVLIIALALLFLFGNPRSASAVAKTWDGGCGANTNWSCAANWSDNIVPAAGDIVTFNATSTNNSTVDALFNPTETIVTININAGYTGTVTLATTLHVTTSFVQSAGTFTAAAQTLDMNGSFTLSGGSFTASSGTTSLAVNMTISGAPTFNANGGTWNFDTGLSSTQSCNNVTFNLVTFTHTSGTKTINSNCTLPLGANPVSAGSNIILNGTMTGTGTLTKTAGVFTLNSGYSLSGFTGLVVAAFTIGSGATANFGSYAPFDVNNSFVAQASVNFTAPSGLATFGGNFTFDTTGTFNANGGAIAFDGTVGATLSCGNVIFNSVTITHTGNVLKTISSTCSLPLGNNPTIGGDGLADIANNGILSGTGTLTIGTAAPGNLLTISSTGVLSGFSGLNAGALTATGTTINFGSYAPFIVNGNYTQNSGGTVTVPDEADFNSNFTVSNASGAVFNAPSGTMHVASTFTFANGNTFNTNGGTLDFDGASGTLTCGAAISFNLVTFNHTGGTKTVSTDCVFPVGSSSELGNDTSTGGDITLNGTLTGSGTLTMGPVGSQANDLVINSTGTLIGFDGLVLNGSLTLSGATLNLAAYTTVNFNRHFILNSGSNYTAPNNTVMTVSRDFTLNTGSTFNANGGTLSFNGDNGGTIACNNTVFAAVNFTHTSGRKTINSDCNLPLGNNPAAGAGGSLTVIGTLSGTGVITTTGDMILMPGFVFAGFSGLNANILILDGAVANFGSYNTLDVNSNFTLQNGAIFTATSANMTIGGNLSVNSGSVFNSSGGTVILDGDDQTIVGAFTFFNLTKTIATASTLTFPAGLTQTVLGTLTLKGGSATELLSLVSSIPTTQWQIDARGTRDMQYLNVTDSNNVNATTMVAYDSTDGGNNINWQFLVTPGPAPTPAPSANGSPQPSVKVSVISPSQAVESVTLAKPSSTSPANERNQPPVTSPSNRVCYQWLMIIAIVAASIGAILICLSLISSDSKKLLWLKINP